MDGFVTIILHTKVLGWKCFPINGMCSVAKQTDGCQHTGPTRAACPENVSTQNVNCFTRFMMSHWYQGSCRNNGLTSSIDNSLKRHYPSTAFCDTQRGAVCWRRLTVRGADCLHHQRPNDGGITHLWNVGLLKRESIIGVLMTGSAHLLTIYIPESCHIHTRRRENLKSLTSRGSFTLDRKWLAHSTQLRIYTERRHLNWVQIGFISRISWRVYYCKLP
jgi:hypothetical protein